MFFIFLYCVPNLINNSSFYFFHLSPSMPLRYHRHLPIAFTPCSHHETLSPMYNALSHLLSLLIIFVSYSSLCHIAHYTKHTNHYEALLPLPPSLCTLHRLSYKVRKDKKNNEHNMQARIYGNKSDKMR